MPTPFHATRRVGMFAPAWWLARAWALGCLLLLTAASSAQGGEFTLFGPQTFTRETGAPVTVRIQLPAPAGRYVLRIESDTVASARVVLNDRPVVQPSDLDRKSTRLNSSHANISYAVFCLKKIKHNRHLPLRTSYHHSC